MKSYVISIRVNGDLYNFIEALSIYLNMKKSSCIKYIISEVKKNYDGKVKK